jgi:hypothetical protein
MVTWPGVWARMVIGIGDSAVDGSRADVQARPDAVLEDDVVARNCGIEGEIRRDWLATSLSAAKAVPGKASNPRAAIDLRWRTLPLQHCRQLLVPRIRLNAAGKNAILAAD